MSDDEAREDARREYQSSLEDLTFNSKPHINMLTILAEENLHFAKDIVAIIEAQIVKAPAPEKLPVLYLVDSIVKNIGGEYLSVFAKNLVTSFICVFEKVDENTRKSLFKLRSTWDEIFPATRLYTLDVRVNSLDPAWPIKPLQNPSIHVNPKFLKQSEETPPKVVVPKPPPVLSVTEKKVNEEQAIRQQLLAKQKELLELQQRKIELELEQAKVQLQSKGTLSGEGQARHHLLAKQKELIELQQKKIEIELEQTKVQLAFNRSGPTSTHSTAGNNAPPTPSASQATPAPTTNSWLPPQSDKTAQTRDPRLKRSETALASKESLSVSQTKELMAVSKKETHGSGSQSEKRLPAPIERHPRHEDIKKMKIPRKELPAEEKTRASSKKETLAVMEERAKSKSASPASTRKEVLGRSRHEPENAKSTESGRRDPRLLRRHAAEKSDAGAEDAPKEKKRSTDKKEKEKKEEDPNKVSESQRQAGGRSKLSNGSLTKQEKLDFRIPKVSSSTGGVKRSRSRSRSRSPSITKRKERRSPKSVKGSSTSPPKFGKGRQGTGKHSQTEESGHHGTPREDRLIAKSVSEQRRQKRSHEERSSESRERENYSNRETPESKENVKRWRSGWEDNKRSKHPEESPSFKPSTPKVRPWTAGPQRSTPSRRPSRLSADENLHIPEVLNSASKADLLKKASKRHADGEITSEEFLNVAHQIRQLFQYQEEKQRSNSWEIKDDGLLPTKGRKELPTNAEQLYLEHKSKLIRTRVQLKAERAYFHYQGIERASQLDGDLEAQRRLSDDSQDVLSRREGPRRGERSHGARNTPSPRNLADEFSRHSPPLPFSRSSPLGLEMQEDPSGELSPIPRFESPNSVHSDEGMEIEPPLLIHPRPSRSMPGGRMQPDHGASAPETIAGPHSAPRHEGPGHPQRFEGHKAPPQQSSSYDALPGHIGKSRPDGPPRGNPPLNTYEDNARPKRYDGPGGGGGAHQRFDGPHDRYESKYGPRFDQQQQPLHEERFEGPGRYESNGPHRPPRFDGPHPQSSFNRFERPMGHGRFEAPGPGPGSGPNRFDGPIQPNRFEGPLRFNNPHMQQGPGQVPGPGTNRFDGPMRFAQPQLGAGGFDGPLNQPGGVGGGPIRFEGPSNQQPGMGFDNPSGPIRFEGQQPQGIPRYECPRPAGPPMFNVPQGQILQQGQPMFNVPQAPMTNPGCQQPAFNMPNRFAEPMSTFPGNAQPFLGQQNVPQGPNFNVPQVPTSTGFPNAFRPITPYQPQPGPAPNLQQPMNLMPGLGQPFMPQNPLPFNQPNPQFAPPESHLGQMDVNDLLSKLISTGIIKPSTTDTTQPESTSTPPPEAAATVEEEEEEEQVEDDLPDLTNFSLEDMKQRYDSVVTKLYTGIQCYSCGMRFTSSQTDVYADHLDWHYRQNRSEKDISKKVTHRRWYYSLTDWIEFEEIADLEERAKSQFFEKVYEEVAQKTQEAAKEKEFQSVKAAPDVVDEMCEICQEQFEMYWEEDEEEWHLKDAIRVDDKTYHPSCYEDYINQTSSFGEYTPSPNKVLTENPLSALLKQEEEGANGEEATSAEAPGSIGIKQEPELLSCGAQQLLEEIVSQVKVEEKVEIFPPL